MESFKMELHRILNAINYSVKGLESTWKSEAAFRLEVWLTLFLSLVTFFLPVTNLERIAMIGSLFMVIIVELINTAIETVVDRIGGDWHELSGQAKDIGSAAVFMALIFAGFVWISIIAT